MRRPSKPDLPPPPELPSFRIESDPDEGHSRAHAISVLDRHEGTKLARHDAPLEEAAIDADAAKVVRRLERAG